MSISNAISSALSGLNVASRRAEIVSSNISNALTDGYGRRSVAVSSGALGGVRVDGVIRHVDPGLLGARRLAEADMGANRQAAEFMSRLDLLVGQIGGDGALSTRLSELEQALVAASADPASDVRLNLVVDRLQDVTRTFNTTADGIQSLRQEADAAIADQVAQLNERLERIERLNGDISDMRNRGVDPSGLIDERQRAIDEVAAIVPVREIDRGRGQVALMTPAGQMLLDGAAARLEFNPATMITADMTLAAGGLDGLTLNGTPLAGDGVGKLAGGTLGQSFALRDTVLPGLQTRLDAMARDMLERVQDSTTDPSLGPADAGLLTDAGARFDPLDTDGLSARIAVNDAVDPDAGGDLWRLRDGIAAAAPGPVGATAQLNRWLDVLQEDRPLHLGGAGASVAGHMSTFLSDLGSLRVSIDKDLAFQSARWEALKEAELSTGVDTDIELQSLLQLEQAYAANARVLQTVDSMIRNLLEL